MNFSSTCFISMVLVSSVATAGNCLVQGNNKIGDCANVNVGPAKPLTVARSGSFSGNYADVSIKSGVSASIHGNTDNILVEKQAHLNFSGNADHIRVFGTAEISGTADHVTAESGSQVLINGIVDSVSGSGKVKKAKGAIVGGEYIR